MALRQDADHMAGGERLDHQIGVVDGQHRDGQLDLAPQQLVRHVRKQRGVVFQAHPGVLVHIAGDHRRQEIQRQAGTGTQLQFALGTFGQVARQFVDAQCLVEQLAHFLEQPLRLRGGRQLALVALEQAQPQALLGMRDQAADRRLRDEQQAGHAVHRAGQHHRPERLHLPELEAHPCPPHFH
ncbi:Uncharacterised protein [Bordetella pertussis]|nr:Uncharacterised protein [Bordetella pertussis]